MELSQLGNKEKPHFAATPKMLLICGLFFYSISLLLIIKSTGWIMQGSGIGLLLYSLVCLFFYPTAKKNG